MKHTTLTTRRNENLYRFLGSLSIISLLMVSTDALAVDVLDKITASYRSDSVKWFPTLFAYAKKLFWMLATIEFAWAATTWVLEKDSMTSLTATLIKKIMGISVFYALLLHADTWIPAIVNSLKTAGQKASGITAISPSQIVDLGITIASTIMEGLVKESLIPSFAGVVVGGLSAIIIMVAFIIVAAQLMIALIESYIALSAGVLFLGFGGSRWTVDFAQKYISYAFSAGVKLFAIYLILGIGMDQAKTWPALVVSSDFGNLFVVVGGALVLGLLCYQIPSMAASMLSGAPSLTAGAMAQTGAMVAGGVAAAAAMTASPALGAARGGVQAAAAGYSMSREGGGGMLASVVGGLGQAGKGIMGEMGRSIGSAVGLAKPSTSGSSTLGGRAADSINNKTQAMREQKAAMGGSVGTNTGASAGGSTSQSQSGASTSSSKSSSASPSGVSSDATSQSSSASVVSPPNNANHPPQSGAQPQQSGMRENSGRRIGPPQIPNDSAPPSNVQIKLGHSED